MMLIRSIREAIGRVDAHRDTPYIFILFNCLAESGNIVDIHRQSQTHRRHIFFLFRTVSDKRIYIRVTAYTIAASDTEQYPTDTIGL